jgi:metal-sulfur cluster biosynthetic enzyme
MTLPDENQIREALQTVIDPELNLNVVDLGLVRRIDIDPESAEVRVGLTLTSPMCPMGPQIMADVRQTAMTVPNVEFCEVDLVWSPPWDPRTDASEEVKAELGIWD